MKEVKDTYGDRFFRKRNSLSWRVPMVCDAIIKAYPNARSVVDCGAAIGDYVKGFCDRGLAGYGLEGSEASRAYWVSKNMQVCDLRVPFNFPKQDLCMSLEVLEHVEEEYAEILVRNLTNLSDNVLVSAAPPGQLGVGHVNCQHKEYWIKLFDQVDFSVDHHIMNIIHKEWEPVKTKKAMSAYYSNLLVFRRN